MFKVLSPDGHIPKVVDPYLPMFNFQSVPLTPDNDDDRPNRVVPVDSYCNPTMTRTMAISVYATEIVWLSPSKPVDNRVWLSFRCTICGTCQRCYIKVDEIKECHAVYWKGTSFPP